ncbi:MAG: tetratricopeptide repeat protein [Planctomycetota bacterium]|nr:tetratricopeptide repeat protein [Planctomycetota bacterium]
MATKVNFRLLTIIGLLVLIALVIVGGLLFLRLRGNVERNLRTANEYYEVQDWKKARGYYGRVLNKQPGNNEAITKLLDVWTRQVPETTEEARELYQRYLLLMNQAALHAPIGEEEERARKVLEEHFRAAALTNEVRFWRMLRDISNTIIQQSTEENELLARAYYLRGMSALRLEDDQLTADIDGLGNIRFPGEDDLEKHLELMPESDIGWAKLAYGRMAVARRLGLESRYAQEEKNLKLAQDTFQTAVEKNPQGVWTNLELLRDAYVDQLWYLGKNLRDPGSVPQEQLLELRENVLEKLANVEALVAAEAIEDVVVIMDFIRYLRLIDGFEGEARAAVLLESALEKHPGNDILQYSLALSRFAEGKNEESLAAAQAMLNSELKPVSLEARSQWTFRILAAKLAFDNLYQLYLGAEFEDRDEAYAEMIVAKEVLEGLLSEEESPILLEVKGKIAVANRRWAEAANLFEQVIATTSPDAMTYRLGAMALEQNGQKGLAAERLRTAIEEYPNDLRNYHALAELYGRTGQADKGVEVMERLPTSAVERNPMLTRAYQSLKVLAAQDGELPTVVDDPILIALAKADQSLKEDDPAAALAVLQAVQTEQKDVRVLVALAHVTSLSGNQAASVAHIDEAIKRQPTNDRLKLLRVRYGDPIEGVKIYCEDRYPEQLERDAMIYENLRSLVRIRSKIAERAKLDGDTELETKNLAIVEAAREAMEDYRAAADQAVDSVAGAYIGRFEELLLEGKYEEARAMLPSARENNFDGTQGNLAEARLEMTIAKNLADDEQDNTESLTRGIVAAQRATELAPWSDLAWRTLGWGYELQGNMAESERAYSESFRRNPSNAATFQKYIMLMLRPEGDATRALAVLRESADQFEDNVTIQDLWLGVEARYGDPAVVYLKRKKIWEDTPEDRNNALRLAALLATVEPSPDLILTDDGTRAISSRQWLGMSATAQSEILGKVQARWDKLMDSILLQIEDQEDDNFGETILHARVYVDRQQVDKAVAVLRRYLRTQADQSDLAYQTIAAAQFLIDSERSIEATQLLTEAIDSQSNNREIDSALGSMFYSMGQYEKAIHHLNLALESPEPVLVNRHRLIESLLRTQQFDEGRRQLELLSSSGGSDFEVALLNAYLAEREALLAGAEGDSATETAAIARFRQYLRSAIALNPDNAQPYELLVNNLLIEYLRTGHPALLDEANRIIDNASSIVRNSETLMLAKADIYEAENNSRRAIQDMEQFLRSNPNARTVRERLILTHAEMGNADRAKDTIQAAVLLNPDEAEWHEMLGEFLTKEGDISGATTAYVEAFDLSPTRRVLSRLNDSTRSAENWDHEAVLKMVQKHQRMLESSPMLQSIHAKALARVRATAQAKNRIREARDNYFRAVNNEVLPPSVLPVWYEDLQVVFAEDDPMAGEAFALGLIEGEPTLDDYSGLAMYWSRWKSPEAWDKAIARQVEAIELAEATGSDRLVEMLTRKGSLELSAGLDAEASVTFKKIVDLTPQDTMALNNYAYLLATLRNDPAGAYPYAQKAIRMSPDNPAIIDTMATIQFAMGKHDAALTGRLKQLEYQPKNPDLLSEIAMLYADHSSTPEKAVGFAERATEIRPRDAVLLDVEGWAFFRAGRSAKGEDLILQSIRRQPTARAHLHLAEIYLDQNRVEKAREQLRLAVEIADDDAIKAQVEQMQQKIASGG